jgi:hypothetical protein
MIIALAPFKGECINAANGEEILLKDAVPLFYSIVKKRHSICFFPEAIVKAIR